MPSWVQEVGKLYPNRFCCRCCEAVELFAAACIRLGIPQHSQPVDPYTGEPVPDPSRNLYLAATPQPLRRYLSGMLPGMHAMAATPLHDIWPEADLPDVASVMPLSQFFRSPVSSAVLKVGCAVLCCAVCAVLCCAVWCCAVMQLESNFFLCKACTAFCLALIRSNSCCDQHNNVQSWL